MSKPAILRVVLFCSASNANKTYETLQYTDGSTSCSCKGWTLRTTADGGRDCRHTRLIRTQHYRVDPTFLTETHYYGGAPVAAADVPTTKRKSKPAPPPSMMGGRKFNL